jgi:hypothetical protein
MRIAATLIIFLHIGGLSEEVRKLITLNINNNNISFTNTPRINKFNIIIIHPTPAET